MKAFPNNTNQQGMDLRDYFAAKIMQSFLSAKITQLPFTLHRVTEIANEDELIEVITGAAYQIADAMVEARKKTP